MCITAMKPYSGPECLIGKVALVVGGSTGMFLLLIFRFVTVVKINEWILKVRFSPTNNLLSNYVNDF